VSARVVTGAVKLGLAALGIALGLAATAGSSAAQDGGKPAAAPAPAAAGDAAAKLAKGRELFDNYGCGSCHALSSAGATGDVGPSFDGDANLTESYVVTRVTNGQGAMPAFGGQMSPEELADLAAYVTHAAAK
jgi:mono/diheme cytochrome c family protein